jgi:predicted nucleic acid-binding protein
VGLVLDTSILIDDERRRLDVRQMLLGLALDKTDEFGVSAVSLMEPSHGIVRAKTSAARQVRETFLDDLRAAVPTIAVTDEIAIRAGEIDGTLRQAGLTIGMADAMIAATALVNRYAVATFNVKHFKVVPDLKVVEL